MENPLQSVIKEPTKEELSRLETKKTAIIAVNLWLDWYNGDPKQNDEVMWDVLVNDYLVPHFAAALDRARSEGREEQRRADAEAVLSKCSHACKAQDGYECAKLFAHQNPDTKCICVCHRMIAALTKPEEK